jgi:NAD(P)H-dependent flavin oxidoreductase YrpB (nitropropane dioxygenase family)
MADAEFMLWVALPAACEDLGLLRESAGLARPLVDLRYGRPGYADAVCAAATALSGPELTAIVGCGQLGLLSRLPTLLEPGATVVLSGPGDLPPLARSLRERGLEVAVEVNNAAESARADELDPAFLFASGSEAGGPVSDRSTLVLLQEVLDASRTPLVVRGSLGPQGAAAAYVAGCSGCVLDTQLLLTPESPLSAARRGDLAAVSAVDTHLVGTLAGRPIRVAGPGAREVVADLERCEYGVLLDDGAARPEFGRLVRSILELGLGPDAAVLPVGQGIEFAKDFARRGLGVREVLLEYHAACRKTATDLRDDYPLSAGAAFARSHGVRLPVVQGPMALVSGDPRLAGRVAAEGGLPVVSATGMGSEETRALIRATREALRRAPFGVGLVGFAPGAGSDDQIDVVLDERPECAVLAGSAPAVAVRLEAAGVRAFLHAPSPAHVNDLLDAGVRGMVLEGGEAGGHVGSIGSLVLWEIGVSELARRDPEDVAGFDLLLAGGVAGTHAAAAAAAMALPACRKGAHAAVQVGTAYLATEDAVACGACPDSYRRALRGGGDTIVTGRTVNLPARWRDNDGARRLLCDEVRRQSEGIGLPERKEAAERDNLEQLRRALGSEERIGATPALMCGQAIAIQSLPETIRDLHEALTAGARRTAQERTLPAPPDDIPDDAVAIVGMGCILPDADSVGQFWQNLLARRCSIRKVPERLWRLDLYYDPSGEDRERSASSLGAFVEGFERDPVKFRIPPVTAESIDDIQFYALEAARQALEDAGYFDRELPRERTGVIIGTGGGGMFAVLNHQRVHI